MGIQNESSSGLQQMHWGGVKAGRYSLVFSDVAQRVGRGIALLFHDLGTRRG
jgi:hypothetical protein